MEKISLHEALKRLSELRMDQAKTMGEISREGTRVVEIDGKEVIKPEELQEAEERFDTLKETNNKIVELRKKISEANTNNGVEDRNIRLQELKKLDRSLEQTTLYIGSRTEVVSGVGLVKEELPAKEKYEELNEQIQKEIRELQSELNEINVNTYIEI